MAFAGLISPLVTPFTPDASAVDEGALRSLVDAQISDGIAGLIACGTTGEFTALTRVEREQVTEIIIDQAAGRVPVFVQSGSTATTEALALSAHAQRSGAAGLLVPPPYYGSLTDAEIVEYYSEISAVAAGIPICIYNIPSATGVGMTTEFLVELAAKVPTVRFVKDSTGDLTQQTVFLQEHADALTIICGEELLVAPGLLLGLTGAIVGCANIIGTGMVKLMEAGKAGDFREVARINAELTPLMRFIVSHPYSATVKAAMEIAGIGTGTVRGPLLPLDDILREKVAGLLSAIDPAFLTTGAKMA